MTSLVGQTLAQYRITAAIGAGGMGTELVVLDTVTLRRTSIDVRLPGPAAFNEGFAVSPDDRTIYYGAARAEADIWIVERSSPASLGR